MHTHRETKNAFLRRTRGKVGRKSGAAGSRRIVGNANVTICGESYWLVGERGQCCDEEESVSAGGAGVRGGGGVCGGRARGRGGGDWAGCGAEGVEGGGSGGGDWGGGWGGGGWGGGKGGGSGGGGWGGEVV